MKIIILGLSLLFTVSSFASPDINVQIETDTELTALATGHFIATKNIASCKKTIWEDGVYKRIFKNKWIIYVEENGSITVPGTLDSKCDYKRRIDASLSFEIKGVAKQYNSVLIFFGGGNLQPQTVTCRKVEYDDSGVKIDCSRHITTTDQGEARVIVKWK